MKFKEKIILLFKKRNLKLVEYFVLRTRKEMRSAEI